MTIFTQKIDFIWREYEQNREKRTREVNLHSEPRTWVDIVSGRKSPISKKHDEIFFSSHLKNTNKQSEPATVTIYTKNIHFWGPSNFSWYIMTNSDLKDVDKIIKVDGEIECYKVFLKDGNFITAKRNQHSRIWCTLHNPNEGEQGLISPVSFEIIVRWYNEFCAKINDYQVDNELKSLLYDPKCDAQE